MTAVASAIAPSRGVTNSVGAAPPLSWKRAALFAIGATVAFHVAYAIPVLSAAIVLFLYCVLELSGLPTARRAFYFGLATGYAVYAPHLTFFWTIFGWAAIALWTVLAFWLGLFVALARLGRLKFGRWSLLLIPFLWSGLEYFRSELYYLRFSWLSAGYAFSASPQIERPIAKPTKPSTGAAWVSQWSTFSSFAPRPSRTHTTPSRPSPERVCLASISASERSSTPSIFQTSTSTPAFWTSSIVRRISSGRSSAS